VRFRAVLVTSAVTVSLGNAGYAACSEIDYSGVNYLEQVNQVLVSAGVASDFAFDRYQGSFVYNVCTGDFRSAKGEVASGVVTLDHAVKIAVRLGEAGFATELEEEYGSASSKTAPGTGSAPYLDAKQMEIVRATFEGMSTDERIVVQEVLRAFGYYGSSQDGKWGAKTQAAVGAFFQEQAPIHGLSSVTTPPEAKLLLQQIMAQYDMLEAIGDVEANEG